jgi:hypothetical protein
MVPMLSQRQEDVWGSGVQLHARVYQGLGGNALFERCSVRLLTGTWIILRFLVVFLRFSRHVPEQNLKLRPFRFLPHPFEFIIH